jgi:hypothetical protein
VTGEAVQYARDDLFQIDGDDLASGDPMEPSDDLRASGKLPTAPPALIQGAGLTWDGITGNLAKNNNYVGLVDGLAEADNWNNQPVGGKKACIPLTGSGDTYAAQWVIHGFFRAFGALTATGGPTNLTEVVAELDDPIGFSPSLTFIPRGIYGGDYDRNTLAPGGTLTTKRVLDTRARKIRFYAWPLGKQGYTFPAGTFIMVLYYFPDSLWIANNAIELSCMEDGYRRVITFPAMTANEWNLVEVDMPAYNEAAAFTDRNGVARPGVVFNAMMVGRQGALTGADAFLHIGDAGYANGADVYGLFLGAAAASDFTPDGDGEEDPEPAPVPERECPSGSTASTAAVENEFEIGIRLDLDTGLLTVGTECGFPAMEEARNDACTEDGRLPGPLVVADRDGYIGLAFDGGTFRWGGPEAPVVFVPDPSTPGTSTTFIAGDGTFPVDPDDDGLLAGLVCAKCPRDADGEYREFEFRRIASNTAAAVTVATAWTNTIATTDRLLVAPLAWMFHLPEVRTRFVSALRSIAMNLDDQTHPNSDHTFPTLFRLEVFEGAERAIQADNITAVATKFFNANDLLSRREIFAPRHASKARSYRLTVIGRETGMQTLRNLILNETVHSPEAGK